jgi:hypothetical protein
MIGTVGASSVGWLGLRLGLHARVASRTLLGKLDPWQARGPVERRTRERRMLALVVALAALILALDYASAPFVRWPPLFVVPVALASWLIGPRLGVVLAILLPAVRYLYFVLVFKPPWVGAELVNSAIQLGVLLLVAYLVSRTARQAREVRLLKSFLPICVYCQKIREADGHWRRLDHYMLEHTQIRFSHGWCPDCEREHFPELAESR